jgi:uncharacterized protein (DUF1501 family)
MHTIINRQISRRAMLGLMGATAAWFSCGGVALAAAPTDQRFVFVILRGAMDGLTAVPPLFDASYASARKALAMTNAECLPLDGQFGLHPALAHLHQLYSDKQALIIHAVASPYRERSHFDAQDVLENGTSQAHAAQNGWLGRALAQMHAMQAIAMSQNIPLALRGADSVSSWSPSTLPETENDLLQRLGDLYQSDTILAPALHEALAADAIADDAMEGSMTKGKTGRGKNFPALAKAAGSFLAAPNGPRLAMLEIGGWDTHAGQGTVKGRLANNLQQLDNGLAALQAALGAAWSKTTVLCATEFGRTVAANGTGGTDHGTGGAAFLLGGAVAGGRVMTDWPGLASNQLYQNRDLRPTTDIRAVIKAIFAQQFGIDSSTLANTIFPDSRTVRALDNIIKT